MNARYWDSSCAPTKERCAPPEHVSTVPQGGSRVAPVPRSAPALALPLIPHLNDAPETPDVPAVDFLSRTAGQGSHVTRPRGVPAPFDPFRHGS